MRRREPLTIGSALQAGIERLSACSDTPRLDAEILLSHLLGTSRAQLLARDHRALEPALAARWDQWLARREHGEPVAYLTGIRGFWSLDLAVSPAVLVPRPETELLVEWALERLHGRASPQVVDLGTGSGAIALAIASERADAQVRATDASAEALAQAGANAARLRLPVHFERGDWYAACAGRRFDLIVSNPPYVAEDDAHLLSLKCEPRSALTPGGDGLSALRTIVAEAPHHLLHGGSLLVEHGADQGAAVRTLFEQAGFRDIETRRDLAGLERATGGLRA